MGKKSAFTGRSIPSLSTRKSAPVTTNFARGIYTYKPNDTMDSAEVRLAQDARFDRVGEYGTRPGYKRMFLPLGSTLIYDNASGQEGGTTPANAKAMIHTAASDGTLASARVESRVTVQGEYSVVKVNLYINHEFIESVCYINDTRSLAWHDVFFTTAPSYVTGDQIMIVTSVQSGDPNHVIIGTNGATNIIRGRLAKCTPGPINSIFEANIDGAKSILFTHNNHLYFYPNASGNVTYIRTLPAGTTKVRYCQNLNTVRYTDGKEGVHMLTPTITDGAVTGWTDAAITAKDLKTDTTLTFQARNIMNGTADNLVYMVDDPDTEAIWTYPYGYTYAKSPAFTTTATISGDVGTTLSFAKSTITPSGYAVGDWITGQGTATGEITNIGSTNVTVRIVDTTPQSISSYDKFSTDFYQNFPAIKTGDPLTAMFNLGGVLYFMTRRNKYQMYAQTADSWSQSNTNAQNGTFSQESIVCDLNYAYFANDNGIYIFDGASEASITEGSIQNVYDAIPNKEQIVVDLYKNRLYVFYPSTADGPNDHCLVYNINLHVWESFDSNTYVSATSARQNSSNRFICGHSKIGMLMIAEDTNNNDYSDFGHAIAFNLETSYQHFGTTSQQKRITKWRPQFATTTNPYTVECGYSLDYTDQVKYAFSIDLQRQVPVITNHVWDNPSDYGVPAIPTRHTTSTKVNGEFYRCQIRYQHIAAFEPVIFRSHTLTIETQRIR